jgi:hypothetical protein
MLCVNGSLNTQLEFRASFDANDTKWVRKSFLTSDGSGDSLRMEANHGILCPEPP